MIQSLFPKSRLAVIALLYGRPDRAYYLRQIARESGLAVGNVQRELARLTDDGILSKRKDGRRVYFQANQDCLIFKELRGIVRKVAGIKRPADRQRVGRVVVKKVSKDEDDSGYMPGTIAERVSSVWDITQSVWAFVRDDGAGLKFQRDVSVLNRPGC